MWNLLKDFKNTMVFLKGKYIKYSIGIVGMTIGYASSAIIESYLLKQLLDENNVKQMGTIYKVIGGVVVYVIFILILLPVFQFMFNATAKYGYGNIKKTVYAKYSMLPSSFLEEHHSGELISVFTNDSSIVATVFMRTFRRTIASLIIIFVYIIIMAVLDWRLTLCIVIIHLLSFIFNIRNIRKLKDITKHIQKSLGVIVICLINIIDGISVIRMFNLKNKILNDFIHSNKKNSELCKNRAKYSIRLNIFNYIISMLIYFVLLICGNILVSYELTSYGNILAILGLQVTLDHNIKQFGEYFPQFYHTMAYTNKLYEFLQEKEEHSRIKTETINNPSYIEMKNLNFSYGTKAVLKNFNLCINKGDTVGIIGESGSGKSSVAKLLLGFYQPNSGGIVVAGKNIGEMTLKELRKLIAYVPQDAFIFNVSIMENIRYGKIEATDDEVILAAKKANAHGFISEQPKGYQTIVGERGSRLSGGQCQRIAIARAILKDAPILLLDEATSALDTESEQLIKKSIDEIRKDKTTIIIAHRLSTIQGADQIYTIQ